MIECKNSNIVLRLIKIEAAERVKFLFNQKMAQ